jgi:hypothetical protein
VEEAAVNNANWPAWSPPEQLRRLLSKLPPVARAKFQRLTAASADAEALIMASIARTKPLEVALNDAIARLNYTDAKADPEGVKALEAEIEELRAHYQRLDRERATRQATKQNLDQTISTLREVFILGGKLTFPVHEVHVDARPRDGETLTDAILRTRNEITAAQSELRALRNAAGTLEELGVQVLREVERKAARGRPRVNVNAGKVSIAWPDVITLGPRDQVIGAPQAAASDMLCWLHEQEIAKKLFADLVTALPEGGGLSEAERSARLAETEAAIARREHEEEALIEAAIAQGIEVHRRTGASPWALLGIAPGAAEGVLEAAE